MTGRPALWTAADAAAATGGRATQPFVAAGVSIDTRTLEEGDLFVALAGPSRDAHDFLAEAHRKGAAAAMVHRVPDDAPAGLPLLVVGETLAGLNALAAAARQRTAAKVIAVTGSVGKTGTKEMLRLILARQAPTHAAIGSYNNQWGVPLTLARMPADAAYAVIEIGMNHAGEIAPLSRLARPHVAIITTVEPVHLEFFASVVEIAEAKAEIFAGLEPDGTAVLNRDSPHFARLIDCAFMAGAHIESFGQHPDATARPSRIAGHADGSCVAATIAGAAVCYKIGAAGVHWVMNSLAALLAVRAAGADLGLAMLALADMQAPKGRGERHRIAVPGGGALLIDDSYNASPVSMRAAFAVLKEVAPEGRGRRIAVLGDMRELGARGAELHAGLAPDLAAAEVALVFACGPLMQHLVDRLPERVQSLHRPASTDLIALLRAELRAGDVVLVKGSLGSRMGPVVEALRAGAAAGDPAAQGAAA